MFGDRAKWLFCYGTLRDDALYEQITKAHATPRVPATLTGWRQQNVPGTAYIGAVPARFADQVAGDLRRVEALNHWSLLDAYEGDEYERVPCTVRTATGRRPAFVYKYRES
jgi:gamma-glutamylcyclotransferase (GGCT)/AIG2-like uncharacterized protein YtfP